MVTPTTEARATALPIDNAGWFSQAQGSNKTWWEDLLLEYRGKDAAKKGAPDGPIRRFPGCEPKKKCLQAFDF